MPLHALGVVDVPDYSGTSPKKASINPSVVSVQNNNLNFTPNSIQRIKFAGVNYVFVSQGLDDVYNLKVNPGDVCIFATGEIISAVVDEDGHFDAWNSEVLAELL